MSHRMQVATGAMAHAPTPIRRAPSTTRLPRVRALCSSFTLAARLPRRNSVGVICAAGGPVPSAAPTTATAAVEAGLARFHQAGDAAGALKLFQDALKLNPNEEEARAALYNAACALTKLGRYAEAADRVVSAVNDHNLKLSVAVADSDLAPLRERREWTSALDRAAGGITTEAYVKLRAEAKAPFRLTRIILFGGLASGAALGLLVSLARLAAAFAGGEGAPDLTETAKNCGINVGALSTLGFLLWRDLQSQQRDQETSAREEGLAQLQVAMTSGRVVPLAAFRGVARPVVVAGTKRQVAKALATAKPFMTDLRDRGVSVVPVVLSSAVDDDVGGEGDAVAKYMEAKRLEKAKAEAEEGDPAAKLQLLKAEFSGGAASASSKGFAAAATANPSPATGGEKAAPAEVGISKSDRKWELRAAELSEWEAWLRRHVKAVGGTSGGVYVQVQLDGSLRGSGRGVPPWRQFVDDLPPLDSLQTRVTDGIGMS